MQVTGEIFRRKLPLAGLPSTGSQYGHYSTDISVLERIEWHSKGLRGIMKFSPRSFSKERVRHFGSAKFVDGVYVGVEGCFLSERGSQLRKIESGETARRVLKLKRIRKTARYVVVTTRRDSKNYSPSHTTLRTHYRVDVYPL